MNKVQVLDFMDTIYSITKHLKDIKCWVAGGAALSIVDKHHICNDVDLFFEDEYSFNSVLKVLKNKNEFEFVSNMVSGNAVTFEYMHNITLQLVDMKYDKIENILSTFDFDNVMVAVNLRNRTIVDLRKNITMNLTFNSFKSTNIKRIVKYMSKGYIVNSDDFKHIIKLHSEGQLELFYGDSESDRDKNLSNLSNINIMNYLGMVLPTTSNSFNLFFDLYSEELLYASLFNNNIPNIMLYHNKCYAKTREQELAFEVYKGNYDTFKDEIMDNYPEYFITNKQMIHDIKKELGY
jgi:hypothetical protein